MQPSFKNKMSKGISIYLIACAILMHLAFGFVIFDAIKKYIRNSSTFAQMLTSTGHLIQDDYPLIKPIGAAFVAAGKNLTLDDYFWTEFDANNWPSVGPQNVGHFTNVIPHVAIGDIIFVQNSKELTQALKKAMPGNVIVVRDGDYHFKQKKIRINDTEPSKARPIFLVAENTGKVNIFLNTSEGIYINKPYWRVIGFNFKGSCPSQSRCDHALHVVGRATNFYAAQNNFIDFNAAIKVNRLNEHYPDKGILEYNHFYFTEPRKVKNSVTPINLDHANQWSFSHNIIRDFAKVKGNKVSYAMFIKGGAVEGSISNNLVICSSKQERNSSIRVGISIGGGGMTLTDRRNNAAFEGENIRVNNNIIMHCNDVGLYINKGKNAHIYNNTLYNTAGIDLRFPVTSGKVENNLLNGKIRYRDDAQGEVINNKIVKLNYWSGYNEMQEFYQAPSIGNFTLKKPATLAENFESLPSQSIPKLAKDFCNQPQEQTNLGAVKKGSNCFYHTNGVRSSHMD